MGVQAVVEIRGDARALDDQARPFEALGIYCRGAFEPNAMSASASSFGIGFEEADEIPGGLVAPPHLAAMMASISG